MQVSTLFNGSEETSGIPPIPNVLKVFLENGQTKSFKYDFNTKVKDVILSLKQKLCIQRIQYFALVLEQVKSLKRNKLTLLDPEHTIIKVSTYNYKSIHSYKMYIAFVTLENSSD